MIAGLLLAIPLLFGAPVGTPAPEPLDANVFDAAAFPDVLIDIVVPTASAIWCRR